MKNKQGTLGNQKQVPHIGHSPRQDRGRKRVEQILEAATAIIVDSGIEQLTIQNLSKASRTSAGSLYHFFPNLDAVIQALAERHDKNIQNIVEHLDATTDKEDWVEWDAGSFIQSFFGPYARYLRENRDYLPVQQLKGFVFGETYYMRFLMKAMQQRNPEWTQDQVDHEVNFMHSLAIGAVQQAFHRREGFVYDVMPKIILVLELYLQSIEDKKFTID
ncbi:TetR/AcrR family transcriptional regulator (plasmid) [Photobacterium sp. GJ3]|uniref:TetR/AcrR family transcriptional regulator n=1 Tax=Photobacterium sp. GJ3 TaxID=2829502 RepID=UPI001B8BE626|nr:TetR/AcrR family transcriptional regulator [Photobacterium sp. GJ3]QUJ70446.1 TetR/AcrR family transcriptional regulator [Photobacterium sp. GJ3]